MLFRQLFDHESSTYTYLIADEKTKAAILIDPVLEQVERDLQLIKELGLVLRYCFETHIHADHITGTGKLRQLTGCLGIVPDNAPVTCADKQIKDKEIIQLDGIIIQAIATPGHTNSHAAYLINNERLFTGDSLLIRGCGRTDFQSGNAGTLFDVITQKLFTLPDETLVYPGHDYKGFTVSTIQEEKQHNPRFTQHNRDSFIHFMSNLNLPNPQKIMAALPANERCGNAVLVNN
ncbi:MULTISPECIES: MBL fold metallo-hydrolase [unclassified Anabaena]|jgi:glyoxylase-like metal-dependent hydrolase (beta-lactamase superfamily II)|uniref:MBL fold metallo-hydrolase n=1 Tax=unclassified Anabaena TaxID=2619674 RepID=UPI001447CF0F|nr:MULTISPECIES: MBL fold metallo-hydrolase [unclassified Anabaena]MTJ08377.1 MBL fold metallo-hydrolase [Anabaena sp. UHCC 0204]MTJ51518.1 MBL fold metallo-hydrolase [Anabaena sp. UHCC 0253]